MFYKTYFFMIDFDYNILSYERICYFSLMSDRDFTRRSNERFATKPEKSTRSRHEHKSPII